MSDAITLDVLSSSPVQLDAGDADPIAREEIAALAGRVEAIEADGSVTTAKLADGAVTGQKLADGSVTLGKLAEDVNDRISTYWAWFQDGEDRRLGIVTDEQE